MFFNIDIFMSCSFFIPFSPWSALSRRLSLDTLRLATADAGPTAPGLAYPSPFTFIVPSGAPLYWDIVRSPVERP
jgi:hypothetical protein